MLFRVLIPNGPFNHASHEVMLQSSHQEPVDMTQRSYTGLGTMPCGDFTTSPVLEKQGLSHMSKSFGEQRWDSTSLPLPDHGKSLPSLSKRPRKITSLSLPFSSSFLSTVHTSLGSISKVAFRSLSLAIYKWEYHFPFKRVGSFQYPLCGTRTPSDLQRVKGRTLSSKREGWCSVLLQLLSCIINAPLDFWAWCICSLCKEWFINAARHT